MENTASTTLFFTYFVDLHQTKENDTRIVTVALFCQKICPKNPYLAAILNFPDPTGSSFYKKSDLFFS